MKALRLQSGPGVVVMRGFPYVGPDGPRDMNDLRVVRHPEGYFVSFWEPSDEDRARIAAGMPIMLWIMGSTQPPVFLDVSETLIAVEDADGGQEVEHD